MFITVLCIFILGFCQHAQAQQLDIGIFESETPSTIEVRLKPDFPIDSADAVTAIIYTLRWDDPGIDIQLEMIDPFHVIKAGSTAAYDNYMYQVFAAVPLFVVGEDIDAGEEIVISSFSFAGGECAIFEIIEDEWTAANNGNYYTEYNAYESTGIIYEPMVQYASVGGAIEGGGVMYLGEDTGIMQLVGQNGDVMHWQRNQNGGGWQDLEGSSGQTTLVDTPDVPGNVLYRAVVQNNQCPADTSAVAAFDLLAAAKWTGSENDSWSDARNWRGQVPNAQLDAIVPGGTSRNQPVVEDTAACRDLVLTGGSLLSIAPEGHLNINATLSKDAQSNLLIQSDGQSTGSLVHNTPGIEATIEQQFAGWNAYPEQAQAYRARKLISSMTDNHSIQPAFVSSPPEASETFFSWNESSHEWVGAITGQPPDLEWNPGHETHFITGKSYLAAYAEAQPKHFSGPVNVENVMVDGLTHSNNTENKWPGMHLLGNPFASSIVWDPLAWETTNIGAHILLWDEGFASFRVLPSNGIIPTGSGFAVYVTENGNGSVTIPADARSGTQAERPDYDWPDAIILSVADADQFTTNEIIIRKDISSGSGFDPQLDAPYFPGPGHQFFILSDDQKKLMLQTIPAWDGQDGISLGFRPEASSDYELTLNQNIPGVTLWLHDLQTSTTHNLNQEPVYAFAADENDDPARFVLLFENDDTSAMDHIIKSDLKYYDNTVMINHRCHGNATLELFDLNAYRIMQQRLYNPGKNTVSLHDIKTGIYIVRLTTQCNAISKKIFVNGSRH